MLGCARRGNNRKRAQDRRTNAARCCGLIRLQRRLPLRTADVRMRAARINAREALIVSAKRNARLLSPFCARWLWAALLALIAASCATIPGGNYPKQASSAFDRPEATALGQAVAAAGQRRPGLSGFRLLADGGDSLRARLDLAAAAQR